MPEPSVLLAWMQSRRSVRRFSPQPVPPELVQELMTAATWAPSAHNRQPWRFVVLQSGESRERLAQAMGASYYRDLLKDGVTDEVAALQVERSRQRIVQAPLAVLLCLDMNQVDAYADAPRQQAAYLMMTQSVALAGGYLLLAAHAHGLGGVWMCAPLFAPAAVRQALELPPAWEPQALLLIGYPARIPPAPARRELAKVTRYV